MKKALLLLVLSLAAVAVMSANTPESVNLHLKLARISRGSAPEIVGKSIIFTLDTPARYAGVVFEHEDYAVIHSFERMKTGVFALVYPIPTDASITKLKYRFVADGVWMQDRNNPAAEIDESGIPVSVFELPPRNKLDPDFHRLLEGRTANFIVRAPTGETVTVEGSFNGWDPFMYEMDETSRGVYELSLPLSAGVHYYAFVVGGQRRIDMLNPERAWSSQAGMMASVIRVR